MRWTCTSGFADRTAVGAGRSLHLHRDSAEAPTPTSHRHLRHLTEWHAVMWGGGVSFDARHRVASGGRLHDQRPDVP
jgi:hypothetical protein